MPHKIIIQSLHDARVYCTCGRWSYTLTGPIERCEALRLHRMHRQKACYEAKEKSSLVTLRGKHKILEFLRSIARRDRTTIRAIVEGALWNEINKRIAEGGPLKPSKRKLSQGRPRKELL